MRKTNVVNFDMMLRDGRLAVPPLEIRVLSSQRDRGGDALVERGVARAFLPLRG